MLIGELFGRAGISYPKYAENIEIRNIVTDSRQVTDGSLFICIKGLKRDGHEYIKEALEKGAAVIVAERVRDECVGGAAAFIMLENTRKVAALLYNAYYGNPTEKLKIIGITGTNGKTTVSTLLYEIFKAAGIAAGLIGTVCRLTADGEALSPKNERDGVNMTTPDPDELYCYLAQMAERGAKYVIMEVSSHALALNKIDAIKFDLGAFTNLTRDHLDFHKTMEEYYRAKSRLFGLCRRGLINTDGEYGKRLALECPCPHYTCSVTEGDFCALEAENRGLDGISYTHKSEYGELPIETPLWGDIALENTLMAVSIARMYGIDGDIIQRTISEARGARGRMERVDVGDNKPTVIIDYAHTPDALERLLRTAREINRDSGRLILLFGCGGERDAGKRKLMGAIASKYADLTVITSDNSRGEDPTAIIGEIVKGIDKEKPYITVPDRREAIGCAVSEAREGDILLLAGKGHEKYEITAEGESPFDETEIVKKLFAEGQKQK